MGDRTRSLGFSGLILIPHRHLSLYLWPRWMYKGRFTDKSRRETIRTFPTLLPNQLDLSWDLQVTPNISLFNWQKILSEKRRGKKTKNEHTSPLMLRLRTGYRRASSWSQVLILCYIREFNDLTLMEPKAPKKPCPLFDIKNQTCF